jgi:diacylglycerol kinase
MGSGEDQLINQISQIGQMNTEHTKFSIKARFKSFAYAFAGIKSFFYSQHNAWIHFLATAVVIFLAIVFQVSNADAMALTGAVGFVWVSELFNTAIERIMDFISVERNPKIKLIKDLSAAAVLIAAISALVVGCIVFIPKI